MLCALGSDATHCVVPVGDPSRLVAPADDLRAWFGRSPPRATAQPRGWLSGPAVQANLSGHRVVAAAQNCYSAERTGLPCAQRHSLRHRGRSLREVTLVRLPVRRTPTTRGFDTRPQQNSDERVREDGASHEAALSPFPSQETWRDVPASTRSGSPSQPSL
jgi:hypothetical protein